LQDSGSVTRGWEAADVTVCVLMRL